MKNSHQNGVAIINRHVCKYFLFFFFSVHYVILKAIGCLTTIDDAVIHSEANHSPILQHHDVIKMLLMMHSY